MSRINLRVFDQRPQHAGLSTRAPVREATVVVVEDEPLWSEAIGELCAFLEVRLARVSSHLDLGPVLRDHRPMAVLANMDAAGQDGPHVMKVIAAHDPDLPIMVLTDNAAAASGCCRFEPDQVIRQRGSLRRPRNASWAAASPAVGTIGRGCRVPANV